MATSRLARTGMTTVLTSAPSDDEALLQQAEAAVAAWRAELSSVSAERAALLEEGEEGSDAEREIEALSTRRQRLIWDIREREQEVKRRRRAIAAAAPRPVAAVSARGRERAPRRVRFAGVADTPAADGARPCSAALQAVYARSPAPRGASPPEVRVVLPSSACKERRGGGLRARPENEATPEAAPAEATADAAAAADAEVESALELLGSPLPPAEAKAAARALARKAWAEEGEGEAAEEAAAEAEGEEAEGERLQAEVRALSELLDAESTAMAAYLPPPPPEAAEQEERAPSHSDEMPPAAAAADAEAEAAEAAAPPAEAEKAALAQELTTARIEVDLLQRHLREARGRVEALEHAAAERGAELRRTQRRLVAQEQQSAALVAVLAEALGRSGLSQAMVAAVRVAGARAAAGASPRWVPAWEPTGWDALDLYDEAAAALSPEAAQAE